MGISIEDVDVVKPVEKKAEKVSKSDNYFEITGLPSKMRFYPEGTVIEGRPMKVLEAKLLSSLSEDNFDKIVNEVLTRTIRGINVQDLIVADKYFIVFWLRANTYKDSSYTMKFDCPHCNKKDKNAPESEYNFGLDCLNVNHLKAEFDFKTELSLPQEKTKLLFRLPTITDETKLADFKKNIANSMMDIDDEILQVANVIASIDGESQSLLSKYNFLTELFPGDYAYIESYIESFDIGISESMDVKCNKCGGTSPVGITFQKEFFLPKFVFGGHS